MAMDFLTKNIEALARRQPEAAAIAARVEAHPDAAILPSRNGAPGLKVGKQRFTSSVDPVDEGARLAAAAPPGPLAVLGFGLGYHLEPLLGRDLLVFEPDPRVLKAALGARDLVQVLEAIHLVLRPEDLAGRLEGRQPLIHPPTARLHPTQAQGLLRRLAGGAAPRLRPHRPRVLVIPPLLGGSLPVAYWCAEALTALGCQVRTLPMDACFPLYDVVRKSRLSEERMDRVRAPMIQFLSELTVLQAETFRPHLCFVMAQAPLNRLAVEGMQKMGVPVAFWFIENYRLMSYYREVAAAYDYFFHIQGSDLEEKLDRLGANHSRLPMAAHPPMHRPLELTPDERERYGAVLGFMGAGYPNRVAAFTRLAERGLEFRLWGDGWPARGILAERRAEGGRRLESAEVTKVYNACDMVLNLHSSPRADQGVGQNDFVNPRTFEVPACGGFMLVDRVQGLDALLAPGREVAVFSNEDQLLEMAAYYRDRPELRDRMARAARRRVLNEHTYYHRMETVLTRCLGPAAEAPAPGPETFAEAGPDQAARLMLEKLAPAGNGPAGPLRPEPTADPGRA